MAAAIALGCGAVAAAIGLMTASAWLLSRAAEHPPEAALTIGIVLVQVFGLSRGPLRYGERLVGHDAAFGCSPRCGSVSTADSNASHLRGSPRSAAGT